MNTFEIPSFVFPFMALAIPAMFALAAIISPKRADWASLGALGLALGVTAGTVFAPDPWTNSAMDLGVRMDPVTCVMLLLVVGFGAINIRYSTTYLQGDPGRERYVRWLLLTLGTVTSLVIANNLAVVVLAWCATSVALHQLLTFYSDRSAAIIAAHKKFLVSRLADVCLLVCLVLIYRNVGSFNLTQIGQWAQAHADLTPSMHMAAVCMVIAVALKSAQLPFHGWLTQVMEAPTPVSALLHAGVVNIGGFVLIRLAPWMAYAHVAQFLLVVIGLVSAVVAALIMSTRISVKVSLAWSTCAQMGWMLVQCGLGLWQLAMFHLVAHSLYKAHAFLSAGQAVDAWRLQAMAKPVRGFAWVSLGAALLYVGCHAAATSVVSHHDVKTNPLAWWVVGVGFLSLLVVKATLQKFPNGRFARTVYPWLFAGLYLDERFTRLTFRIWPVRRPQPLRSQHIITTNQRYEVCT